MKDYDDDVRNLEGVTRGFVLRGIEFTAKPTMPAQHLSALSDLQSGAAIADPYGTLTAAIRDTLVESDRARWDELLAQDLPVPINLKTLMQISDDLVADATGRPPTPPTPSGSTGENGSTKSTDVFASMAAPASAPSTHGPA